MPFPPSYYQMFLFDDRFHRHKNPLRLYFVETSLNGNANQIIFSWLNAIIYRCGVKTIHAIAWLLSLVKAKRPTTRKFIL